MAILVTTGLFSFMRAVTDFDGETDPTAPPLKLELARLRPPTEIEPKPREKPKIKKPDPQYPPQAQQKRLEGWVHVRFTVSSAGSVEDAGVVESSDRVFEKSALQAVAKWKYQPSLRAGQPVEAPDQRVVLRFQQPEG
jgi:protein TonB